MKQSAYAALFPCHWLDSSGWAGLVTSFAIMNSLSTKSCSCELTQNSKDVVVIAVVADLADPIMSVTTAVRPVGPIANGCAKPYISDTWYQKHVNPLGQLRVGTEVY